MEATECPYKLGDLVRVSATDLIIRKDGFVFGEDDCDENGKIPRDWFIGSDEFPLDSLCTFVRQGTEDPAYAVVQRDLIGRVLVIKLSKIALVSSIDDAVED